MWHIREHRNIEKLCQKLPNEIVKKYELWKNMVFRHGPEKLREFPGFHDEALKGKLQGKRSVRLNRAYRAIYLEHASGEIELIEVLEVNKHEY